MYPPKWITATQSFIARFHWVLFARRGWSCKSITDWACLPLFRWAFKNSIRPLLG